MERKDLYWLAGLLEGEGSFQKPMPSEPKYPRLTLSMNDLDIVERVSTFFGRKYIYTRKRKVSHHKDTYSTMTKGKRAIQFMWDLYPLMGERRKGQIENAIGAKPTTEYMSTDEDWFNWLAGLLEGEGSFMHGTPSNPRIPRIHLKMTDKDIIEKVATMFQAKYYGPYRPDPKNPESTNKPYYIVWSFGKRSIDLMQQLQPLMGQRRQIQINAVIEGYAPLPQTFGDNHPQAKLTAEKVSAIKGRLEEGETLTRLVAEFGVDTGLIWQIKAGRIWRHVT